MLKCDFCNNDFYRKPSEIKLKNYCSYNCWLDSKCLINERFGKLLVKTQNGNICICICDCGREKKISRNNLLKGTQSCGCLRRDKAKNRIENLTGLRFGKLSVIRIESQAKRSQWLCKCDCGNEKIVLSYALKNGNTRSCGCLRGVMNHATRKLKRIISSSVRNSLKTNKNGKTFDFLPYSVYDLKSHLESLWEPWMNWKNFGGKASDKKKTWWIDHIKPHSFFNYKSLDDPLFVECWQLSNLQPMEKIANIKKGSKLI